jgi:putative ABC transport system permease protein
MFHIRAFASRLRDLVTRRRLEAVLDEELRTHLAMLEDDYVGAGMSRDEARRQARLRLGGIEQTKEGVRDARALWIGTLGQDVSYAWRRVRHAPGLAAAIILTTALAVGLATAIYSVAASVLLRPFPYQEPDRLVTVWRSIGDVDIIPLSIPDFADVKRRTHVFEDLAGIDREWFDVLAPGVAEYADAFSVTPNLFAMLGVRPVAGRTFLPYEDQRGHEKVVVLDELFWRRAFGADRGIVGKRVRLAGSGGVAADAASYEVIGVAPATMRLFFRLPLRADIYVPRVIAPAERGEAARLGPVFFTFARLRQGVTVDTAASDVRALLAALAREHPKVTPSNAGSRVTGLHEELVGQTRPAFALLAAAALVLLLIACGNVANLVLASGVARSHELRVRLALGASRARLVRQLMTEHLGLALAGGACGVLIAAWATPLLAHVAPPAVPRADQVRPDFAVLVFAAVAALVSGLASGLAPCWFLSRSSPGHLRVAAPTTGGASRRLRRSLVVAETALVFVLLAASALIANGLWRLAHLDHGFEARHVLVVNLNVPFAWAKDGRAQTLERELLAQIRPLPGVSAASAGSGLPFTNGALDPTIALTPDAKALPPSAVYAVEADYLRLLNVQLRKGRMFGSNDAGNRSVAIVNETIARRLPDGAAVGRRIRVDGTWREIVGVVGDVTEVGQIRGGVIRLPGFGRLTLPAVYVPSGTYSDPVSCLLVRTPLDPRSMLESVRKAIRTSNPDVTVRRSGTLQERLNGVASDKRFYVVVMAVFAGVALVLAAVGLFSLLSHAVRQSTRDIGIRAALGASPAAVRWLVVRQALALVVTGIIGGLAAALAAGRTLRSFLFEVSPSDPLTLAAVVALIALVAALAAYLPARRATRIDPMAALRCD